MVRKDARNPNSVRLTVRGAKTGIVRLIPIGIFVAPYGIAFGIAATESGLDPHQAVLMSALVFTATAQFAALDFLSEPVAYASLALVAFALSARHIIMGAALSTWINQLPLSKRMLTVSFLSDANFADSRSLIEDGNTDLGPLLGGGLTLWTIWVISTAVGAYGGEFLGNTDAYGFGVVMVCFFSATVFGIAVKNTTMIVPIIVAMAVSALSHPYLPTGWNIILAAIVGGLAGLLTDAE